MKKLSDKIVIEILKQAEIDFRKDPNIDINNTDGLCYYLKDVFGLDWFDVEYILEKNTLVKSIHSVKG